MAGKRQGAKAGERQGTKAGIPQVAKGIVPQALGNPYIFIALLALAVIGYYVAFMPVSAPVAPGDAAANCTSVATVDFFYLPSCPHCKLMMPENARLAQKYPCAAWKYHDLNDRKELGLLLWMDPALINGTVATPTTIVGGRVLVGFDPQKTPIALEDAIEAALNNSTARGS